MSRDAPDRNRNDLILLGGGGHAKVVFDAAILSGWRVRGFLDDRPDASLSSLGAERLGGIEAFPKFEGHAMIVAIGSNPTRIRLANQLIGSGIELASVIHPAAIVSGSARIGVGVFVAAGAIVNPAAQIGLAAIVNTGAVVEHDVVVEMGAHLAPNSTIAGESHVGVEAMIGAGAVVIPGRRVGDHAVVGAGAVVIHDVQQGRTVAGTPARPLR